MKILAFGEVLWDVYPEDKYIGGAPLNFAAHLSKLGETTFILSSVGQDELGNDTILKLKELGVDSRFVGALSDYETGKCVVSLDENSIPSYNLLENVAYDHISCEHIDEMFDVLYFGTLALRSSENLLNLSNLIKTSKFQNIFCDVNIRPPHYSKETVLFAFKNASIIKISDEELPVVLRLLELEFNDDVNDIAEILLSKFPNLKCIIITLGSKGAFACEKDSASGVFCPSQKVNVVSTVGAGDSFSAAFLHKYLCGNGLRESLEFASALAGFVVSRYEAIPSYDPKDLI